MIHLYNEIYVQRNRKWIVKPGTQQLPYSYLATAMKNIEQLGFTFSKQLIKVLLTQSKQQFVQIIKEMEAQLKKMVGAHVVYRPMYAGFPAEVMEMSDAQLYINSIYHYLTLLYPGEEEEYELMKALDLLPQQQRLAEDQILEPISRKQLRVLDLGTHSDFYQSIQQLLAANGSLTPQDKEDLSFVLELEPDVMRLLPESIPFKENASFVAAVLLRTGKASAALIQPYFQTATDVLRLATALSEGDVSLAALTRFRSFKRSERRLLLALVEQCSHPIEDMLRYKERWLRLGEVLHPSEYRKQYPRCAEAFDMLRKGVKVDTFNSKVEQALRWNNSSLALDLLTERPGELARRLDHLLRVHKDPELVSLMFEEVAGQVATPVLLQVMTHFSSRAKRSKWRVFFPKGIVGKAIALPNNLPAMNAVLCQEIVDICRQKLLDRFATLPSLGKVFVDPNLRKQMVPFALRSASKSLRTLARGSRLPMPEGNTVRFFLWWKEGKVGGVDTGRVDIDLSAIMYNKDWQYMEHISYTNLRSIKYRAAHSGDIVTAPNGACEFIDIDIASVLHYGGRYIVTSLHSFTGQPFCELPECHAGWMMRRSPASGEKFKPSTVVDKIDLAADTQIAIPVILDLLKREVIWCDLALTRDPSYFNNVEGNESGLAAMGRAMTTLVKPALYDLFELHALARGEMVHSAELADMVFGVNEGITPFDTAVIQSQYL